MRLLSVFLLLLLPLQAWAESPDLRSLLEAPCVRYGVPVSLALAIARHESGEKPWAVNIAGRSYAPASRKAALALIESKGKGKSYDVGFMQVNVQWLRKLNISPVVAIEPVNNAWLGVWILARAIREHGLNWKAVGAYHSPTPARQRRYAIAINREYRKILQEQQ